MHDKLFDADFAQTELGKESRANTTIKDLDYSEQNPIGGTIEACDIERENI